MKNRWCRTVALVLLCLPGLPVSAAAQVVPDEAAVDRVFQQWARSDTPGCAVGVALRGDLVFTKAWGMADLEHDVPNTPATVFEAGSVSKQVTAAAVLLLAQQGRISLEDDIRRYVPEIPDYGATIRVRHLLHHTSGLRDWGAVAAIGGWGRDTRTFTNEHALDILSRQRGLNFAPGSEYSYSNSGYNVLAVLVERVSGSSLAEFSRRHIFEPLGMTRTQWRDNYTRIVRGRAAAYSATRDGYVIDRPIEHVYGQGGLLTTVADLLTWNAALADDRVGAPGLAAEMLRQGTLGDGTIIEYAAGLRVLEYNGVREVSHTGATAGYRAFLARYPDQQLSVALLCNAGNADPGVVGRLVANAFLGDAARAGASAPRGVSASGRSGTQHWTPTADQLAAFTGDYHSPDAEATLRVRLEDEQLVAYRRPAQRIPLSPTAPDAFDSTLGGVTFIRDAGGGVIQLSVRVPRVYDLRFDREP